MRNILARTSGLYLAHLCTFAAGMGPLLMGRRGVPAVMTLFLPIWVMSSVLWTERDESYGFLRTLPVTDRQVVRLKFGLAFGALLAYASILLLAGVLSVGLGEAFVVHLKMAAVSWAGSLLLAAVCYIGMWGIGPSWMTGLILGVIPLNAAVGIGLGKSIRRHSAAEVPDFALLRAVDWVPWYLYALAVAVAIFLYWVLSEAGVRVKASSEAHL